jgi:hypothetical protein
LKGEPEGTLDARRLSDPEASEMHRLERIGRLHLAGFGLARRT